MFFLFTIIQIITGAPTRDVTALIGKIYWLPGNCAMVSQINNNAAPVKPTAGSRIL